MAGNASSSGMGDFSYELTVYIETDSIITPAGVFSNSMKAVTSTIGNYQGVEYDVLATEWYVLDVGMIKQAMEFHIPFYGVNDTSEMILTLFQKGEEGLQ